MDSTKETYAKFPFEWTVKSTSYQIRYREAININEIDDVFCSIITAKLNEIKVNELGAILGFNFQDLAEIDVFNIYLKGLSEYNLIAVNNEIIQLTELGQEAFQTKLKYKYFFAETVLFENCTATGEMFDFSFKNVFDLENGLSHKNIIENPTFENPELKQKLQYQLFENDIYKGEIIELYQSNSVINYKKVSLHCEITALENSFQLSIYKSNLSKPNLDFLIEFPENKNFKSKLIRKGKYHHILSDKSSINVHDINMYIDLWNWKELAVNPRIDWSDKTIFELFQKNGDGSVWNVLSENAPIESIKSIIQEYTEYWNWTILTNRLDNKFIREQIERFHWDMEQLSYKDKEFVMEIISLCRAKHMKFWESEIKNNSENNEFLKEIARSKSFDLYALSAKKQSDLVSILTLEILKEDGWDWNYLSRNLPDDFIETSIHDYPWDFYLITEEKSEVLRNLFRNNGTFSYSDILLSKPWNWKFISEKFDIKFLFKNISLLAPRLDWDIVLERFFTDSEISLKCLNDELFKQFLINYLPLNFIIAHQKYLWTLEIIDFFNKLNLIQWETKAYIDGFDTNENVEWNKLVFEKYQNEITTEKGFLNVSLRISDYTLINENPNFAWNWIGISQNKNLINNPTFIENAIIGNFLFFDNLFWNEILSNSNFEISFWNKNIELFHEKLDNEKQIPFWQILTRKQEQDYIFAKNYLPWDWTFVTENVDEETILDSFGDNILFEKWDWEIATPKLDKNTILENLEDFARFVDWKFLVKKVFNENELAIDKQLARIATCLGVVDPEIRQDVWKDITAKIPFELLFPIIEKTFDLEVFEWDWDYISNHKLFPTDISTINKFKHKLNWVIFSESNSIKNKFEYKKDDWDNNYNDYFKYVKNYLVTFKNYWVWSVLSKNSNIHYNREFINLFESKWDWQYLSQYGGFLIQKKKDKKNYLLELISNYPKIQYEILSKRDDIIIDSDLILATKDKNWNWEILSENQSVEISSELVFELKDKDWNWQSLSHHRTIEFSNEFLLKLSENDWDWEYLSNNKNLEFNTEFIDKVKSKNWDWKSVSRHSSFLPVIDVLTLTKDFDLDWQYLSQHSSLNPTIELLEKFESKWDWQSVTENPQIHFSDIDFINRFADKWDWRFICETGQLTLNSLILFKFKKYLDWDLISSNNNIDFSVEIIQEFKPFWNWTLLKNNKRVEELLGNYVNNEINNCSTLNFIDRIAQQPSNWKGSIYHFSHIDNAVEIIKNRKIQSRNKAIIKGDAAGNVVHLRNDAHDYARFYFRPHTPTQFYNEFLGKNSLDGYNSENYGWVSWYEKARGLGFPKCPIPIFFRFSLQEVLFNDEVQCCISNGNMQTSSTQFGSIEKMINKFGFDDLFYTPPVKSKKKKDYDRYIVYAQQEFLVKDELSFNDLSDFEIVCPSESDRALLINLLGKEHEDIFSKIVVNCSYYNNQNPRVNIKGNESELDISTTFEGNGYFVLNGGSHFKEIEISGKIKKQDKDKIIFESSLKIRNLTQSVTLEFIDESNRRWFVYAN